MKRFVAFALLVPVAAAAVDADAWTARLNYSEMPGCFGMPGYAVAEYDLATGAGALQVAAQCHEFEPPIPRAPFHFPPDSCTPIGDEVTCLTYPDGDTMWWHIEANGDFEFLHYYGEGWGEWYVSIRGWADDLVS